MNKTITPSDQKNSQFEINRHRANFQPNSSLFWPVFLVILGVVLLSNNLGIVPWAVWDNLKKFWPMLLIFWGLEILLGDGKWINLMLTVLGVLIMLLIVGTYIPEFGQFIPKLIPFFNFK